jgi:fructoselysine 6-kinase
MLKLATAGDNCIDHYAALGKMFPGGNPVNVAVYATRLGLPSSYTGAVGNDAYGAFMLESLCAKGVDTSHVQILPGRTAVTQVELKDGERLFGDYDEGVLADFSISEQDIDFFCEHELFHTGLWGNAQHDLPRIRARGLPVAFDFATAKSGDVFDAALPFVDYAFFSDEFETEALHRFMKDARRAGPRLVVVTLGENGSIAYDGHAFYRYGIVPVDVVDTMGAGDSYIAGFCKGITDGAPIVQCMRLGAECAAETLAYMGAW